MIQKDVPSHEITANAINLTCAPSQRRLIDDGADAFLASLLAKQLADIDEWESEMQMKAQRAATVKLYCGLDAGDRELTGVELVDSVEDALLASVAASGDRAVAVIPEGPYVVPYYASA